MKSEGMTLEKLRLLIDSAKKKLEAGNNSLEEMAKELDLKKEKIENAQKNLLESSAKILTRKQIEELRQKEEKERQEKLKNERLLISAETKKAFETAKNVRLEARGKGKEEENKAEQIAENIEKTALNREIKILEDILKEKSGIYENKLANLICEESKIRLLDDKEKVTKSKANIKNLKSAVLGLKREVENLSFRIKELENKLEK